MRPPSDSDKPDEDALLETDEADKKTGKEPEVKQSDPDVALDSETYGSVPKSDSLSKNIEVKFDAAKSYLTHGPLILFILSITGGILTIVAGFVGIFGSNVSVTNAILSSWFLVFGGLVMVLEGQQYVPQNMRILVTSWARFLGRIWGRGVFYVFVGTMLLAIDKIYFYIVGCYMCALGLIMVILGYIAASKVEKMRKLMMAELIQSHDYTDKAIAEQFNKLDSQGDGQIDIEHLGQLAYSLGCSMMDTELTAAMAVLDREGNGYITKEDFASWWRGSKVHLL